MLVRYRHPMVHMFKHLTPMESSECSTSFMIIVFSMCFASALDWNKKGNSSTRERLLVNLFMTPVAATTRSMEPERSISNRCALLPEVERVWMFILIVPQEFLFTKSAIFCIPWWSTEFGCITIPACKVIFWF